MSQTRVTGRSGDIIKIELKLTERQRERIVRRSSIGVISTPTIVSTRTTPIMPASSRCDQAGMPRIALDVMYKRTRR
jgi:hypothetical protein